MKPIIKSKYALMNKTEERYARRLENMKLAALIIDWRFDELNFRLAKKTHYRPDFLVITTDRIEMHEVKGFWRDDARVKIKMAARMFPWFRWVAVQWKKKQWVFESF